MYYKGIEYKHIATFEDALDAEIKAKRFKRFNGIYLKGRNKYGLVYRVYIAKV